MPERPREIRELLLQWVRRTAPPEGASWLADRCAELTAGAAERRLFLAFSGAPRHTGKAPLPLRPDDLAAADRLRPGWNPMHWSTDQAARVLLFLTWPHPDAEACRTILDRLFQTADLGEQVALYQALPVLPFAKAHVRRCAEGIRTNMTDVFRAVAHFNPYPAEHLDEAAWNQMVLKALFVGVPLHPIHGLDARANPRLMRMLCDYAHERWAAHRPVSPELWRGVGPCADERALADLERVLKEGSAAEKRGATLALRACPDPHARVLLETYTVELPPGCDWAHL